MPFTDVFFLDMYLLRQQALDFVRGFCSFLKEVTLMSDTLSSLPERHYIYEL